MTIEAASVTAIIVGAAAVLGSMIFLLVRALRIGTRLEHISSSPSMVAATTLPAAGSRIAVGVERLGLMGERVQSIVEQLTAARDASERLREGVASVSACVIDLLDVFAPSLRGSAAT